jgi:alpha-1,2-mannosyltransferase
MSTTSRARQLLLVVFLFFYLPVVYYWGWILTRTVGFDFPSFYYAAQRAFVFGRSPYGPSAFNVGKAVLGWKVNPYLYPPPSLIAFWPLANLSILDAQTLFLVVSHLCLLGSIWLILTKLAPVPVEWRERDIVFGISLVYVLCFDAVLRTLALGQVNLIVLLFLCLTLAAMKENSSAWRIALPLSLAILLKTYPVLLLAPLLFRKRFRAVGLTLSYFAIFTVIAALMLPESVWLDWWYRVVPNGAYANNAISTAFAWNQSMNGWVTRLLVSSEFSRAPLPYPAMAKTLATAFSLTVVGVTLYYSYRLSMRGEAAKAERDDEIAAYLLMTFLIAPLSWDHHLVYVLPAAVLAIVRLASGEAGRNMTAAVTMALFVMAWNIPLDQQDWKDGWWTLLISIKLYSAVVLWIFFVSRLRRTAGVSNSLDRISADIGWGN